MPEVEHTCKVLMAFFLKIWIFVCFEYYYKYIYLSYSLQKKTLDNEHKTTNKIKSYA